MKKGDKKLKVFVAVSGGVDSAVAAALLKEQGYDVYGVFIKGWPTSAEATAGKYPQNTSCTWRDDRRDAMRVCAALDIPFYSFDFSKEYKEKVADYMIEEYKAGRTPNPDVMCNKYIKFDLFLKKAREMGADYMATGHYVHLKDIGCPSGLEGHPMSFRILRAKDKNKDQSYFLWTLTQKQLKHCLFPLGDYTKPEVRELAKKFKLPVAEKPDSQGVCFIGEFKMEDFLKNYIKTKPGKILNEKGETIGNHKGAQFYTIGQRHGIGGGGGKKPRYVVGKDLKKNILITAENPLEQKFCKKEVLVKNVNWISGQTPNLSKKYLARIRYRQPLQKCKLYTAHCGLLAVFDEPQKSVAPGQSLVIYGRQEMLGGGIIIRALDK